MTATRAAGHAHPAAARARMPRTRSRAASCARGSRATLAVGGEQPPARAHGFALRLRLGRGPLDLVDVRAWAR
eukprot:4350948-Prymnesium_polylepis.1